MGSRSSPSTWVIMRGAGPSFCSGYDLGGMRDVREGGDETPRRTTRTIDDDSWQLERGQQKLRVLWDMHKPTIAQIHGYCLAGGISPIRPDSNRVDGVRNLRIEVGVPLFEPGSTDARVLLAGTKARVGAELSRERFSWPGINPI